MFIFEKRDVVLFCAWKRNLGFWSERSACLMGWLQDEVSTIFVIILLLFSLSHTFLTEGHNCNWMNKTINTHLPPPPPLHYTIVEGGGAEGQVWAQAGEREPASTLADFSFSTTYFFTRRGFTRILKFSQSHKKNYLGWNKNPHGGTLRSAPHRH